jgi:opacity protein-like surface antigen
MKKRSAVVMLSLLLGFAFDLRAEETPSFGVGLGLVDISSVGSTLWVTGNYRIPVSERVSVEPEVGFWSKSESDEFFDIGIEVTVKDLNLGANAIYTIPKEKTSFHLGAGVGIHHLTGKVGVLDVFEESDSVTRIALQLLGGVERRVGGSAAVFARVRFDLMSGANQTKLFAGVRLGT